MSELDVSYNLDIDLVENHPIPEMSGENPEVSIDRRNPVCQEVSSILEKEGVPLSEEMKRLLNIEDERSKNRYGNPYALVSGKIMRELVLHGSNSSDANRELFGIETYNAWDDILDYLAKEHPELDQQQRDEVASMELAEVMEDPREFYGLSSLQNIDGQSMGATALLDLLRQAAYPIQAEESTPKFACVENRKKTYGNCKDSESYLSAALEGGNGRAYGARAVVYTDTDGNPVIYQKAGHFHIEDSGTYSNATGITLRPVLINGILVPAGTLVGIENDIDNHRDVKEDQVKSVSEINGLLPLRLSMYSFEPDESAKIFGQQYREFGEVVQAWDKNESVPTMETFEAHTQKIIERQASYKTN